MDLDPAAVLPQQFPFRFVDQLVSVSADACHCRFRVPTSGACFSLRMDPSLALVEALAQTAAILAISRAGGASAAVREGVLGGIDGLRVRGRAQPGAWVDLHARLRKELGPVLLFDVLAELDGEPLCVARLTVRQGGTG